MDNLSIAQSKIFKREGLRRMANVWRFKDKKIVFTNGCFDLMHYGHIYFLTKAADLGDQLVIGLNTDASVQEVKGEHRPIKDEKSRALLLASLVYVAGVAYFDEETPYELIKEVKPDVLVKGTDYKRSEIVGADFVESNGGQVERIETVEGYSTTSLEEKIKTT